VDIGKNIRGEISIQEGVRADVRALPIANNSMDEVFVTNPFNTGLRADVNAEGKAAIEKFKESYFQEIARVTKPGGEVIISSVPRNPYTKVLGLNNKLLPSMQGMGFELSDPVRPDESPFEPLPEALQGSSFGRPDEGGETITADLIRTIRLRKIVP